MTKMKKKLFKYALLAVCLLSVIITAGCSKNSGAEDIAQNFKLDVEGEKAYKMVHQYVEANETLEVYRDAAGNVLASQIYEDGSKDDVYKIDGSYTVYINGEMSQDFEESVLEEFINTSLAEASIFVDDTLEVFDMDIDSDIVDNTEKNIYMALGEYEDGSNYYYTYGKDGDFFEYLDDYDKVTIHLDETILVALP